MLYGMRMITSVIISIVQAFISTICSLCLGTFLAVCFYRYYMPGKRLCVALAAMLSIMPCKIPACVCLMWHITGMSGIIFAHMLLNVPYVFFQVYLTLEHMDVSVLWAAQDLGAPFWLSFRTIIRVLRSTLGGIGLFVFMLCFSSYSIPLYVADVTCYTPDLLMSMHYQSHAHWLAYGYTLIRFFVMVPSVVVYYYISTPRIEYERAVVQEPHLIQKNVWISTTAGVFFSLCLFPIVYFFYICLQSNWYIILQQLFSLSTTHLLGITMVQVVLNSIYVAAISSFCALVMAGLLLWYTCRYTLLRKRSGWLSIVAHAPYLLGSVCVGMLFAGCSSLLSPFKALICSHVMLYYPFAYRILTAQLQLYNLGLWCLG